jgi:hypothetical protein
VVLLISIFNFKTSLRAANEKEGHGDIKKYIPTGKYNAYRISKIPTLLITTCGGFPESYGCTSAVAPSIPAGPTIAVTITGPAKECPFERLLPVDKKMG